MPRYNNNRDEQYLEDFSTLSKEELQDLLVEDKIELNKSLDASPFKSSRADKYYRRIKALKKLLDKSIMEHI